MNDNKNYHSLNEKLRNKFLRERVFVGSKFYEDFNKEKFNMLDISMFPKMKEE